MSASLSFCQGETVLVRGSIQYVGGGAYNITGHVITWVLTATRGGPAILTRSTVGATLTILSGVGGTIEFELTPTETNALPVATYYHECHLKSPANKEYCAWHDRAVVTESTIGVM